MNTSDDSGPTVNIACAHAALPRLFPLLQDQVAALQAELEASKAAAVEELDHKSAELDSMKNKLLTERAANMRQMELSAEVCLQHQGYVCSSLIVCLPFVYNPHVWHLYARWPIGSMGAC
jgi:phosphoenolpyruvate-protein kinase (PTS system EI component)